MQLESIPNRVMLLILQNFTTNYTQGREIGREEREVCDKIGDEMERKNV